MDNFQSAKGRNRLSAGTQPVERVLKLIDACISPQGRPNAATVPLEQPEARPFLNRGDPPADRAMRQAEFNRRRCEGAAPPGLYNSQNCFKRRNLASMFHMHT